MSNKEAIRLFGEQKVRMEWDDEKQQWYFSIVDVCGVLTDQPDYDKAKIYWKVLKFRLKSEGNESVTNCNQLKMVSPKDGKRYKTDVADMEQMFRIIQSISSPKAEISADGKRLKGCSRPSDYSHNYLTIYRLYLKIN